MEPLTNLNSSIAIEQRWAYELFHDYRLLPVISSDERTVTTLSHRPLLSKLIGPVLRRANITSLINSLTGMSLLNSSKDGSLLNDAWEIWEKHRDEQKTINDRISSVYRDTEKNGLAFAAVQKHHNPVRASPDSGLVYLKDLYDKIDSIDGKFVVVPGILSNIDNLASVQDANIGSSLSGSGVGWILSDYPYFAMGHEEFRSGVVLLDMDSEILKQMEGDIPFYKEIGWYPYVRISGYARYPHSQRYGYPSIKVSWLEYRPPKHPDETREVVIDAYHRGKSSRGSYDSLRESGFYVNTDRQLELREFIDIIKIVARGVNLQVGQLRPEIRQVAAEVEELMNSEK